VDEVHNLSGPEEQGYVVKDGFGFGTDLRVYERGDFPQRRRSS